ncbi:MAG: hypothetical protein JJ956_02500 [Pseudomonadales bacterium]|nr:hypothetical protein [Pseudomonadales bacterium]
MIRSLFLFTIFTLFSGSVRAADDCVILLHGLARTADSMSVIESSLQDDGYRVVNIGYPSRTQKIEWLAIDAVESSIEACGNDIQQIHFVTHSLGGILVRYYESVNRLEDLGRVVMLAPPNQGSEVVDNWKDVPGYELLNGPAGMQLGTDPESLPLKLGPVSFELGVIAGTRTLNPILSLSLPNPDDGKVSVERTKVEGMTDFILMPHTHTFIMRADSVIHQIRYFLAHGQFDHEPV